MRANDDGTRCRKSFLTRSHPRLLRDPKRSPATHPGPILRTIKCYCFGLEPKKAMWKRGRKKVLQSCMQRWSYWGQIFRNTRKGRRRIKRRGNLIPDTSFHPFFAAKVKSPLSTFLSLIFLGNWAKNKNGNGGYFATGGFSMSVKYGSSNPPALRNAETTDIVNVNHPPVVGGIFVTQK